jgi:GT2 family glycosyltransferase
LLFLNPDAILPDVFFEELADFFRTHPEASVVGFTLADANGVPQRSCWKKPSLKTVLLESFLPYQASLRLVTQNIARTGEVEMVSGACMAVRKETFQFLGGFDERYFMYYEDADLCLRARASGFGVYFYSGTPVVHHLGVSSWENMDMFFLNIYTSKLQFFNKHYSGTYYAIVRTAILVGIFLRIPAYFLAGGLLFSKQLLGLSKHHAVLLLRLVRDGR